MKPELKIELKTEKNIDVLRKSALAWQEFALDTMLELKYCNGQIKIDELKKIVDIDKVKRNIK